MLYVKIVPTIFGIALYCTIYTLYIGFTMWWHGKKGGGEVGNDYVTKFTRPCQFFTSCNMQEKALVMRQVVRMWLPSMCLLWWTTLHNFDFRILHTVDHHAWHTESWLVFPRPCMNSQYLRVSEAISQPLINCRVFQLHRTESCR